MQINFYADLRPLAGGKTVEVNVHASMTAREALEAVTRAPRIGGKGLAALWRIVRPHPRLYQWAPIGFPAAGIRNAGALGGHA